MRNAVLTCFADLPPTVQWIYALWLAAVGGCVGSFLNVVVYRVPAGLSLVRPGSFCPRCKHPIRWHDNVPVVGWILLRGRCRDCQAKISPRYPLVEAITAAVFFTLAWVELLSDGANLPARAEILSAGELAGLVAFHLTLLCTLLAAALVEFDGRRLPLQWIVIAALAAVTIWPRLHPVTLGPPGQNALSGLVNGVLGLAAGAILGLALAWLAGRSVAPTCRQNLVAAVVCVGLFLGAQAVGWVVAPLAGILLLQWPLRQPGQERPPVPPTAWLALLSFCWLLIWGHLIG